MKRSVFLLTFIFCFLTNNNGIAQNDGFLLDSVRETFTMGYGTYTKTKNHYYYNLYNLLKYDDVITNRNSFPDTADWYCTAKNYHFYDAGHRIIKDSLNSRETTETDWTYIYKRSYYYSDTVNMKTSYYWDFAAGNWDNGHERYNDSLLPPECFRSSHLRQYWFDQTNKWENDYWVDSLFFPDGLINVIKQVYWVIGNPDISMADSILYDYTYYPDTLFTYQYEISYYFLHKIYYTDDSLKKYNFKYQVFSDTVKDTLSRIILYFDDEQRVIKYESGTWSPSSHNWMVSTTKTYQYNEKGLLIQKDVYSGNHQRTKYSYNDDDLLWKKEYYPNAGDIGYFFTDYYYYTYTYVGIPKNLSQSNESILFYPNPAKTTIRFNGINNLKKQYRIYDVTGRLVKNGELYINSNSIDVSDLTPGNYFTQIIAGNKTYQGKFIKY